MSTMTVLDASGNPVTVEKPLSPGQATSINSRPVVIASDQTAVPISASALPLPTGAATAANQTSLNALFPSSLGAKTAANSLSITHATDDAVVTATGTTADAAWTSGSGSLVALLKAIAANAISTAPNPVEMGPFTAKSVAASQTNSVLGATGAAGDYLSHIVIQATSTSPGVVTLYDGSTGGTNATIYSFPGGASSLSNLSPIIICIGSKAVNAGWHVTTGAGVSVSAFGSFT